MLRENNCATQRIHETYFRFLSLCWHSTDLQRKLSAISNLAINDRSHDDVRAQSDRWTAWGKVELAQEDCADGFDF